MKLHILSDIHAEAYAGKALESFITSLIAPTEVLVLAGDIASWRNIEEVLALFSPHYERIIYVPGNHEYYRTSYDKFSPTLPYNVELLRGNATKVGDTHFLGATLWTDFHGDYFAEHAAKTMINDFRAIEGFTTIQCSNLFHKEFSFLNQAIDNLEGPKVVVTHFPPSMQCLSEYWRQNGGVLNKYFMNDLDGYLMDLDEPILWISGHTHTQYDVQIGQVRCVANPYGYRNENPHYSPLTIEI